MLSQSCFFRCLDILHDLLDGVFEYFDDLLGDSLEDLD